MKSSFSLVLSAVVLAAFSGSALAHIRMLEPKPRDNRDDHKNDNAPCIARTGTQAVAKLTAGGMTTVTFGETVNHPGCFVVDFAESDTATWQMLGTVPHSTMGGASDAKPRMYTKDVKLPDKPCTNCVLRVRQIMLRAEPPTCPPATIPAGETYYSCANIELASAGGGGTDAGPAPADAAGTGGSPGTGGSVTGTGGTGTGGSPAATGGTPSATGGSVGSGGSASGSGGSVMATGGSSATGGGSGTGGSSSSNDPPSPPSPLGCAVGATAPSAPVWLLIAFAITLAFRQRKSA